MESTKLSDIHEGLRMPKAKNLKRTIRKCKAKLNKPNGNKNKEIPFDFHETISHHKFIQSNNLHLDTDKYVVYFNS